MQGDSEADELAAAPWTPPAARKPPPRDAPTKAAMRESPTSVLDQLSIEDPPTCPIEENPSERSPPLADHSDHILL